MAPWLQGAGGPVIPQVGFEAFAYALRSLRIKQNQREILTKSSEHFLHTKLMISYYQAEVLLNLNNHSPASREHAEDGSS